MPNDQAQADSTDQTTVTDPLDAVNTPNSGISALAAYEAERDALLASVDAQGDDPAMPQQEEDATAPETDEPAHEEDEVSTEEPQEEDYLEPDAEVPEAKGQMRPRLRDPIDIAVATVAKIHGISLIEAAKIIEGANNTTERKVADPAEPEAEAKETVASLTERIKELRTKHKEASVALEFEAAAELLDQLEDLRDQREELKIAETAERTRAEQKAIEKTNAIFEETKTKAVAVYPQMADQNSAQYKMALAIEQQMIKSGDPLVDHPEKFLILAKAAAVELKIPMSKPGAPAKPTPTTSRVPMQPASGNARTTAAAPANKLEDAIAKAQTLEEYEKLVGRG